MASAAAAESALDAVDVADAVERDDAESKSSAGRVQESVRDEADTQEHRQLCSPFTSRLRKDVHVRLAPQTTLIHPISNLFSCPLHSECATSISRSAGSGPPSAALPSDQL